MGLLVSPPFPIFFEKDGAALDNGYIYIGLPNLNPIVNPVQVYWDQALTIPAAQPIRTINGYPSNSGAASRIYIADDYSVIINDENGALVFSSLGNTPLGAVADGSVTAGKLSEDVFFQLPTENSELGDFFPFADISDDNKNKKTTLAQALSLYTPPDNSIAAIKLESAFANDFPTEPISTTDFIPFTDVSDSNITKKALVSQLAAIIGGGGAGGFENLIVYTALGANIWTKPVGLSRIIVYGVSGGGGGGISGGGGDGLGGRGGGYFFKKIEAGSLGPTETATVGIGGAAGFLPASGGNGGASSFGAHATSTGGGGGGGNGAFVIPSGGVAFGGDINVDGQPPLSKFGFFNAASLGGSSMLGLGGSTVTGGAAGGAGNSGTGYGAGGSGGNSNFGASASGGGAGTQGVICVLEYF